MVKQSVTFKQHYMSKPLSKLEIWYINLITSGRLESLCREWWRKFMNALLISDCSIDDWLELMI